MSVTLPLRREIVLARPLDTVYRYLLDFSTIEQWDPGVRSAEKCTPGPVHVGSEFALELSFLGKSVPMRYTLTALQPPRDGRAQVVLTGQGDGFSAVDTLTLSAAGNHTQLHYEAVLTWPSVPAWLKPGIHPWGQRLAQAAVDGLQRALTADGPVTPSAVSRLGERLVLPGMWNYTRRGYERMPSRGLTRFVDGQTIGVTGVTSGLGLATAQLLGRLGARLVLVGRNPERLRAAAESVRAFAGTDVSITCLEAELSSLQDTDRLAKQVLRDHPELSVWINNAGALFNSHEKTTEGHERTLAVNFLTPALLSQRLQPQLAARQGRLINMVSGGLYSQGLKLDDMQFEQEPYNGPKAYARAKRALLDLSQFEATQPASRGMTWHIVHPGWASTPGVETALPGFHQKLGSRLRHTRQGADTAVWLATHPALSEASLSGTFWFDRAPRPVALLPGTATTASQRDALLAWYRQALTEAGVSH